MAIDRAGEGIRPQLEGTGILTVIAKKLKVDSAEFWAKFAAKFTTDFRAKFTADFRRKFTTIFYDTIHGEIYYDSSRQNLR